MLEQAFKSAFHKCWSWLFMSADVPRADDCSAVSVVQQQCVGIGKEEKKNKCRRKRRRTLRETSFNTYITPHTALTDRTNQMLFSPRAAAVRIRALCSGEFGARGGLIFLFFFLFSFFLSFLWGGEPLFLSFSFSFFSPLSSTPFYFNMQPTRDTHVHLQRGRIRAVCVFQSRRPIRHQLQVHVVADVRACVVLANAAPVSGVGRGGNAKVLETSFHVRFSRNFFKKIRLSAL